MDCIEAQAIISAALDREPVDAALLAAAKQHSRECESCAAFVRTLVALQRTPLPEPPSDLTDRVMFAVRAQMAASGPAQSGARESADVASSMPGAARPGAARPATDEKPLDTSAPVSIERLMARIRDPRNRRAVIAWSSAAATVFIVASVVAVNGVRQILVPSTETMEVYVTAGEGNPPADTAAPQAAPGASTFGEADAMRSATESAVKIEEPKLIVFNDVAYRLDGPAPGADPKTLDELGRVMSALDEAGPTSHDVFGTDADPSRVYLEGEDGVLVGFTRIQRFYEGATFVLMSGPITAYGDWPTLPAQLPQPATPDGSPTFEPAGNDPAGIPIFAVRGSTPDQGFAVAPDPPAGDPLQGCPSWTWWAPVGK